MNLGYKLPSRTASVSALVWALAVAYFVLLVHPVAATNAEIVAQAEGLPGDYAALLAAQTRHRELASDVEARRQTLAEAMHDLESPDFDGEIYGTLERLAAERRIAIDELNRQAALSPPSFDCVLVEVKLSGEWSDYMAFRNALTGRAMWIEREVIQTANARRVAVGLTVRVCGRARVVRR